MGYVLRLLLIPVWAVTFVRVKGTQEATLLWALAVGVEKQFPLVPFLQAMADEARGSWRWKVHGLAELLSSDMSIPDALESVPGILPSDTIALIRVGAKTGNLSGALREAAMLARRRGESPVANIIGTFFHVGLVMFALTCIGGAVMYYVIPKYKAIFNGFNVKMPVLTESMISVGNAGANFWYLIVLGVPLALAGLWIGTAFCFDLLGLGPWWGRNPFAASVRFSPRLKTPPLLRCLAVCIEGGRPLTQALSSLSENHPDFFFRRQLSLIFDDVARGDECWLALRGCGMLHRGEPDLLEAAQRVGNLPWTLRSMADNIERRALYRFQIAMQFIDPALTLAAGFVIATFCVSMFLPLIELLDKLS
ncbi:MAG TPA: type II secretion system F family protein [Planctomycetaceae bacterium]|jgi:type II secretory pathway component PulF